MSNHKPLLLSALTLLIAVLSGGCSQRPGQPAAGDSAASTVADTSLPSADELRDRIDRAVNFGRANRHLDGDTNAAWQVVHGLLAFGKDFEIYHGGKLVPALDYLLSGGELNGWKLRKADHGVQSILEAGSKTGMGHPDQWLGYLSQSGLKLDTPLVVAGETYHVSDLLEQSEWDIYPGMEATWTLMAYSTYLPFDAEWTARDGSQWTIERIVNMEADQDVDGSPCGGTHRLYGLALALNRHLAEGGQTIGVWKKADAKIQSAIAKAKANQQPDGSFSSQFFLRPAHSDDIDKRLGASGHTFEFLALALNNQQFLEPWYTRSLVAILDMLERTEDVELECGGLYHAMHGLELYRLRRFGPPDAPPAESTPATAAATPGAGGNVASDSAASEKTSAAK
ncbi:MAG TPA: ADP-ribosylation factor-directed GTPase activating protein isoform b [Pirellulales bacterium]|nr:ADP-ribosylation factor-directed GTPase activating protein isoform b [Pirellulales bacterium]